MITVVYMHTSASEPLLLEHGALLTEDDLVEEGLEPLVRQIDAQLLEAVGVECLKAKDVEDTDTAAMLAAVDCVIEPAATWGVQV